MPQGRQGWASEATTRATLDQGPHSFSPLGPNNATTGVPTALAMCIGAESTPMNNLALPVSAAKAFNDSLPPRLIGLLLQRAEIRVRNSSS